MPDRAAPVLLIVPTAGEREQLQIDAQTAASLGCTVEVLGFGVVAAAARATELVSRYRPRQVILCGIAGTFDEDQLPIGVAAEFDQVRLCGIGRVTSTGTTTAAAMDWDHWTPPDGPAIGDDLPLQPVQPGPYFQLLTACAASGDGETAQRRREEFSCGAEDMEGFSVAFACSLTKTPLSIVRGISNVAGVVDKSRWRVADAMTAVSEQVIRILRGLSS